MKKIIAFIISIVIYVGLGTNGFAQDTTADKSTTVSALCAAQEEIVQDMLSGVYTINGKIDVVQEYSKEMGIRIAECLKNDMINTGKKIRDNALNGKFKKIKLRFERPSDKKFKVPRKARRKYKRAYKSLKKEFINVRKSKTLNEVLSEKNLIKKIGKVDKILTHKFKKDVNTISK